jgi:hypothetical protein
MPTESSVTKFERVVRGRNLIILAATDVVIFLIANIAYGAGHQHGLRNGVSNVAWALSWSASCCSSSWESPSWLGLSFGV